MNNECKRCLLYESAEGDILESIKTRLEKLSVDEKSSDDAYNCRLELCKNCDNLISGTCLKCGCYVEFRAAFKNKKCPDGKW